MREAGKVKSQTQLILMSDLIDRSPENVPGAFYVDSTCVDCDQCRDLAPQFFSRWNAGGYSIVHRQPQSEEERKLALEALHC
eukprot:gene16730-20460_t